MPNSNKIVRYGRQQTEQHEDAADGAAVQTGHLVERTAAGVQPHSSAAAAGDPVLVAIDARDRGMEQGDQYDAGELVRYLHSGSGAGFHFVLAAGSDLATASNANITDGDELVSNGDGTVRKLDTSKTGETEDSVLAIADEAVDNSGAAAGETAYLAGDVR